LVGEGRAGGIAHAERGALLDRVAGLGCARHQVEFLRPLAAAFASGSAAGGGAGLAVVPHPIFGAHLGGRVRRGSAPMHVVHFVGALPGLVVEKVFEEAPRLRATRQCATKQRGGVCVACVGGGGAGVSSCCHVCVHRHARRQRGGAVTRTVRRTCTQRANLHARTFFRPHFWAVESYWKAWHVVLRPGSESSQFRHASAHCSKVTPCKRLKT